MRLPPISLPLVLVFSVGLAFSVVLGLGSLSGAAHAEPVADMEVAGQPQPLPPEQAEPGDLADQDLPSAELREGDLSQQNLPSGELSDRDLPSGDLPSGDDDL